MHIAPIRNVSFGFNIQAGGEKRYEVKDYAQPLCRRTPDGNVVIERAVKKDNYNYAQPLCTRTPDSSIVRDDIIQKNNLKNYSKHEDEYSIYLNG